jgi:maltooligosyltrehalose trehalohydrolase
LLFMGEEWGSRAPFPYFTSHTDRELVEAVRQGRRAEFADLFGAQVEVPDPQAEATFASARLDWDQRDRGEHGELLQWWRTLLDLRRNHPVLAALDQCSTRAHALADGHVLALERSRGADAVLALLSFAAQPVPIGVEIGDAWQLLLASPGADAVEPACAGELVLPPYGVVVFATTATSL